MGHVTVVDADLEQAKKKAILEKEQQKLRKELEAYNKAVLAFEEGAYAIKNKEAEKRQQELKKDNEKILAEQRGNMAIDEKELAKHQAEVDKENKNRSKNKSC